MYSHSWCFARPCPGVYGGRANMICSRTRERKPINHGATLDLLQALPNVVARHMRPSLVVLIGDSKVLESFTRFLAAPSCVGGADGGSGGMRGCVLALSTCSAVISQSVWVAIPGPNITPLPLHTGIGDFLFELFLLRVLYFRKPTKTSKSIERHGRNRPVRLGLPSPS